MVTSLELASLIESEANVLVNIIRDWIHKDAGWGQKLVECQRSVLCAKSNQQDGYTYNYLNQKCEIFGYRDGNNTFSHQWAEQSTLELVEAGSVIDRYYCFGQLIDNIASKSASFSPHTVAFIHQALNLKVDPQYMSQPDAFCLNMSQ